jgi:hypothetical protein
MIDLRLCDAIGIMLMIVVLMRQRQIMMKLEMLERYERHNQCDQMIDSGVREVIENVH